MKKIILFSILFLIASQAFAQLASPTSVTVTLYAGLSQDTLTEIHDTTTALRTDLEAVRSGVGLDTVARIASIDSLRSAVGLDTVARIASIDSLRDNKVGKADTTAETPGSYATRTQYLTLSTAVGLDTVARIASIDSLRDNKVAKADSNGTGVANYETPTHAAATYSPKAGSTSLNTLGTPTANGLFTFHQNGVILALHTIAAGDSVFGHTILNAADTTWIMWNGTAWKTISDLGN